ncbi:MAG: TIGR03936 family radical SAM-associated protein [Candidatus Omnitrophota bacterium]|nr:TIGR03936 family radical SAM-associated protein [Candidatus Omnitrophota bacterium]
MTEKCTAVVSFNKTAIMRYISHLDLLRLFQRAARRARLKLSLTEGFNPHPKIKIEPAVKLGVEANNLTAEIVLDEIIQPEDLKEMFMRELPGGIKITDVKII